MHYPSFKLREVENTYFRTLAEAECKVMEEADLYNAARPKAQGCVWDYASVITELPFNAEMLSADFGQSLSERIYLPDGTLWGVRDYCNFIPDSGLLVDNFRYWEQMNRFQGRDPEEIRFKPGDIVEVFGYPGNGFWGDRESNLAIVVKCPASTEKVSQLLDTNKTSRSGDIYELFVNRQELQILDTYDVLSTCCDGIDHSPTIATFVPSLKVSSRMREKLYKLYEDHMNANR